MNTSDPIPYNRNGDIDLTAIMKAEGIDCIQREGEGFRVTLDDGRNAYASTVGKAASLASLRAPIGVAA